MILVRNFWCVVGVVAVWFMCGFVLADQGDDDVLVHVDIFEISDQEDRCDWFVRSARFRINEDVKLSCSMTLNNRRYLRSLMSSVDRSSCIIIGFSGNYEERYSIPWYFRRLGFRCVSLFVSRHGGGL